MSETQGQTCGHVCACLHARQANSVCTVQCIWICTHLVFLTTLGGKSCYYPHFINNETGAQRGPGSPAGKRRGRDLNPGSLVLVRICALSRQTPLQTLPGWAEKPREWGCLHHQDDEMKSSKIPYYVRPGPGWAGTTRGRERGWHMKHAHQKRYITRWPLSQPQGNLSQLTWKESARNG